MEKGSRVVIISGIFHGKHGEIVDLMPDGNLRVKWKTSVYIGMTLCDGSATITVKPFEIELEERKDLWQHLI